MSSTFYHFKHSMWKQRKKSQRTHLKKKGEETKLLNCLKITWSLQKKINTMPRILSTLYELTAASKWSVCDNSGHVKSADKYIEFSFMWNNRSAAGTCCAAFLIFLSPTLTEFTSNLKTHKVPDNPSAPSEFPFEMRESEVAAKPIPQTPSNMILKVSILNI